MRTAEFTVRTYKRADSKRAESQLITSSLGAALAMQRHLQVAGKHYTVCITGRYVTDRILPRTPSEVWRIPPQLA